jgi:hypothetical protein
LFPQFNRFSHLHHFYPLVWLILLMGGTLYPAHGQSDSTQVAKSAAHGAVSASVSYGSNAAFFGRTQPVSYPYYSTELMYTSRFGAWASVVGSNLLTTTSPLDETDLLVGWDGDLSKKLDASVSYAHFFFAPNSPLIKSSVNNAVEAYLGYDWGYVYSRLKGTFLFGPSSRDGLLVFENSRYFALKKTKRGVLSVEPKLSLIAGTQNFDSVSVVQQLIRGNSAGKGKGKALGHYKTVTTYATRFTVLAYELQAPLRYTWGKVVGEVSYHYLLPVNVLADNASGNRSYVTATFMLTI